MCLAWASRQISLHALEESLRIFERYRELIFARLQRQPSE
jgi:hypothetical protein